MNHIEEQKSELEAISEIYYNEIKVKSNVSPISFSILIRPQASCYREPELDDGDGNDDDDESQSDIEDIANTQPSVELLFDLPPDYPDIKPSVQVVDSENLEEFELNQLLCKLSQKADESLGAVMIFVLVSDVVEWLSNKAECEAQEFELVKEKKREEMEAEEKRKVEGTPVTVETFLAWKAKFEAELLRAKFDQQKKQTEHGSTGMRRLTGKEMFEKDKALAESDLNFVDELEQEQLEALMQSIDEVDLEDNDDSYEPGSDDDEELDEDYSDSDNTES